MTAPAAPPPAAPAPAPAPSPTLAGLFLIAFRIGLFSFGGGLTVWMHREFVQRRPWISNADFLALVTTAQILPGANVTNLLVSIGYRLFGIVGAAAALVGLLLGPSLAVIGFYIGFEQIRTLPGLDAAMIGVAAAAAGLLALVAAKSAQSSALDWAGAAVFAATFIGVGLLRMPLIPVVVVMAPVSILLSVLKARR